MSVTNLFILISAICILTPAQYYKESSLAGFIILILYSLHEIFIVYRARSSGREEDKEVAERSLLFDYIMILLLLRYIYLLITREW